MAEEMDRPDPYAMAAEMGNSLLAEWRSYFEWKHEQQLQDQAAARVEQATAKPRGH